MDQVKTVVAEKSFPEDFNQTSVLLDGRHFPCPGEQQFSQGTQPGPDLQDTVRAFESRGPSDPTQLIAIVEKVLTQAFGQLQVAGRQQAAHVR
jgi:hypothetical protein